MEEKQTYPKPKPSAAGDRAAPEIHPVPPPPTWQEMIEPERDPRYDPFRRLRH